MSGFLARLSERVLGVGPQLVPTANRYAIAPPARPDRGDVLAEERAAPSESVRRAAPEQRADAPPAVAREAATERRREGTAARDASRAAAPWVDAEAGRFDALEPRVRSSSRSRLRAASDEADESTPLRPLREPEHPTRAAPAAPQPVQPLRSIAVAAQTAAERRSARHAASDEAPIVHVHIGRIDVRAVQAPAPRTAPPRPALQPPSLDDHLRARERGLR